MTTLSSIASLQVEEEAYLIQKITAYPQQRWKQLANRRRGELTSKNVLVSQPMPPFVETYPDIIDRLKSLAFTPAGSPHGKPNHIIINGPAYFPLVATISLGSHCTFHYYQYTPQSDGEVGVGGRSIDPTPIMTTLLEPRSVVITKDALYSSHLHAIREIEEDAITASGDPKVPPVLSDLGVPIANWDRVTGTDALRVMSEGGVLKRTARYSLTCRDVEKVAQLKAFMKR
ncbi:putative alpha-ketoglutarate-dependent dioxygenase ABH6 [Favolaschia claudopus]|uniref:Alpha-ketoglutarate-dependent dioxygenase ABH6 n=1 Tax=Favolaschia claudopus TaxID=2862362 RepID=A0AAW0DVK1_9AGAR